MRAGFHPGKTAVLSLDDRGGRLSRLHRSAPGEAERSRARNAYLCVLDDRCAVRLTKPPRTCRRPSFRRPIAISRSSSASTSLRVRSKEPISTQLGRLCTASGVFDEYRGPQIGEGRKSLGGTRHAAALRRDDHRRGSRRRDRARCSTRCATQFGADDSNVIGGIAWPDVVIVIVLAIATSKAISRGFVSELGGAVAVTAALVTPWFYNGSFDSQIEANLEARAGLGARRRNVRDGPAHLHRGPRHRADARRDREARRSRPRELRSAARSSALRKARCFSGCMLFIALFFPLSSDIRDDLHQSQFAPYLVTYDPTVDDAILSTIPWFARPFVMPYFRRHHL